MRRGLLLCALVPFACYDSSGTVVPTESPALDLGDGVSATYGADGRFVVAVNGAPLLQSSKGAPLFVRYPDPDRPDAWHDPTKPPMLAAVPIDPGVVTMERVADGSSTKAVHLRMTEQGPDTALVSLALAADDGFYGGLGERFDHADARGRIVPMHLTVDGSIESGTNEAHVPVPFFVSSKGYGVFVASREAGAFDVAATDPGAVTATFEGRSLDVTVYVDPDPLAIVARFARDTGLPRPLPFYALSPFIWAHYQGTQALDDATQLRARHIPTSTLWFDDPWATAYNTFVLDPKRYPDPQMIPKLAGMGFRVAGWATPYLEEPHGAPTDEAQMLYVTADAHGDFVKDPTGQTFVSPATPIKGGAGVIDFTSADARAFWESLVARATTNGFSGFKIDYGEEFVPSFFGARLEVVFADGSTGRTARAFPIAMHGSFHSALDLAVPREGFLIVRASSYGGATQADIVWPGDLDNDLSHFGDPPQGGGAGVAVGGLPSAIVAAQTLGASGFPSFGSDTGGYRHGMPPREVLLRWAEHTALTVVMQLGGGGDTHDPWAYDEEAATIYTGLARLHNRLAAYNAVLMQAAETTGAPTIRSLPLAFPSDDGSRVRADDEYMLGPSLLVAPVTSAGATSRPVHLPPGTWIGWWDDAIVSGPVDLSADATLGQPPFYAKAGSILPLLPDGIDTLNDATAPGTVAYPSVARFIEARAWPMGSAAVTLDDGGAIQVGDDGQGIVVTFTAGSAHAILTIDVDVRERTGTSGSVSAVDSVAGAVFEEAAGEAAVRAATGNAYAIDAARGHVWLRMAGAASARIH